MYVHIGVQKAKNVFGSNLRMRVKLGINRMPLLKGIVDGYMERVLGLKEHCERCLRTERWGGNVVLMVIDAAFTSIGLNYFTAVVPKVEEFNKKFVESESGRIRNLKDLTTADINELREIWRNKRSWMIAKDIAYHLSTMGDDRSALRTWARNAKLEKWKEDSIGRIKGVGLITFQYLRIMGGIDTVMPDKIVKRVINEILEKASLEPVDDDIEFIKRAEEIALACRYWKVKTIAPLVLTSIKYLSPSSIAVHGAFTWSSYSTSSPTAMYPRLFSLHSILTSLNISLFFGFGVARYSLGRTLRVSGWL